MFDIGGKPFPKRMIPIVRFTCAAGILEFNLFNSMSLSDYFIFSGLPDLGTFVSPGLAALVARKN